jgi:hypothetical protein
VVDNKVVSMPHGFRRADYWIHPWQIRAIQRLAEERHSTPSAVVRELLTEALPASFRPKGETVLPSEPSAEAPWAEPPNPEPWVPDPR